jgi:hypothetical protein
VIGELVVEGDQVSMEVVDDDIPDAIPGGEALVREQLGTERTISGLPDGLSLDSVEPTEEGLLIGIAGNGVPLS